MSNLEQCPCGRQPPKLLVDGSDRAKWAYVTGDCCGEWHIEFRNQYAPIPSDESMQLAVDAWNAAPRGTLDDA